MTRVREERRRHGTRRGALIGLAATGGVITSAGIVLVGGGQVGGADPVTGRVRAGGAGRPSVVAGGPAAT
jgi:RND superfamily putative drug exporter